MPSLKAKAAKDAAKPRAAPLRVLFPLDGSEESYACLEKSLAYLPTPDFHATLLVVLQDFHGAPEDMVRQFEEDEDDEVFPTEDSGLLVLRQATRRLKQRGVKTTLKLARGKVQKEILAEAADHDLLVMHRRTGKHRFGGATSIARKAACSSLLLRV